MKVWLENKIFLFSEKRLSKIYIQELHAKIYLEFVNSSTGEKKTHRISVFEEIRDMLISKKQCGRPSTYILMTPG